MQCRTMCLNKQMICFDEINDANAWTHFFFFKEGGGYVTRSGLT